MTLKQNYVGIEFDYQQVQKNLKDITEIAGSFLDPASVGVLRQCGMDLSSIKNSRASEVHYWSIKQDRPVRTLESRGEYRASDKRNGRSVYALFSFSWGIKNTNRNGCNRTFTLIDEATTSIRIMDKETSDLVALWQMEIGDASSPGCHFHASMTERNDKPKTTPTENEITEEKYPATEKLFPEWLKVPRLPSLIVTPFDALEFLLCELFQRRWPQVVSQSNYHVFSWSRSQNDRLCRLLSWKLEVLRDSQNGGWSALKRAKPSNAQMFIGS